MTDEDDLRDRFAAAALSGLLAQGDDGSFSEESYVRSAYRWADVMLRERDDRPGDTPMGATGGDARTNKAQSSHEEVNTSRSGVAPAIQPVAWAVMVDGRRMYVSWCKEMCEDEAYYHRHPCGDSVLVVPLYRQPQPTLTDAEQEAIQAAAVIMDERNRLGLPVMFRGSERAATLRGLLERTK